MKYSELREALPPQRESEMARWVPPIAGSLDAACRLGPRAGREATRV